MNGDDVLFTKPLREQVYDYLKRKMNEREIVPGTSINLRKMSSQLGISKTPLRDALLRRLRDHPSPQGHRGERTLPEGHQGLLRNHRRP